MTTNPQDPTPIRSLDDDVAIYLDLAERIDQLEQQRKAVAARIAETAGPGQHTTTAGTRVTVSPPNRRFNTDRGWAMLTDDQRALCVSPDAKKIREQLPPVLAEQCMDAGTGTPRVTIR